MPDQNNPEAVFLEHLAWIERVADKASRRHGRSPAEAEDFVSWVRSRMVADDYAAIRKFRGDSDIKTYLLSVVMRYSSAYLREKQGRWRPSVVAERLGPPAPKLEQLVRRDGYPLSQAAEKLRTEGSTTLSDLELARLLDKIPARDPLRPEEVTSDVVLDRAEGAWRADERVAASEDEALRRGVREAQARALSQMTPEDQVIVKMYFRDGHSVADIARRLHLEQKPLYRRIPRLREQLRQLLERDGLSAPAVREFLERETP